MMKKHALPQPPVTWQRDDCLVRGVAVDVPYGLTPPIVDYLRYTASHFRAVAAHTFDFHEGISCAWWELSEDIDALVFGLEDPNRYQH